MQFVSDTVHRLEQAGIPYAVTGSIASNYWGIPRLTHDLDVVIVLTAQQVDAVTSLFAGQYYVSQEAVQQAVKSCGMFNVLETSSGFKADLWVAGPDAFTGSMLQRRRRVRLIADLEAALASPEDVLLHKLVWHTITPSERQLADAAGIAAVQAGNLDIAYMTEWAARQNTSELLRQALAGKGLKST